MDVQFASLGPIWNKTFVHSSRRVTKETRRATLAEYGTPLVFASKPFAAQRRADVNDDALPDNSSIHSAVRADISSGQCEFGAGVV
jgi:hypothetical protein